MPRIKSKQIIVSPPILPGDIISKEYLESVIVLSNKDTFIISKDDVNVSSGITYINFVGDGIKVEKNNDISNGINVYVPSSYTISHFNTTDNITDSILRPLFNTTSRYITYPTSEGIPFKIGNWYSEPRYIADTIRIVQPLVYETNDYFSIYDKNTTLNTIIYDADGLTEITTHQIIINGNIDITQNNIRYEIKNWEIDVDKYKSTLKVTIYIQNIIPNGGRFSIKITHNNGLDGIYDYIKNDMFRDAEFELISVGTDIVLSSTDNNIIKTVSGIKFLTIDSFLSVYIPNIDYPNSCSYPITSQLTIVGTNTSTNIIEINGEGNVIPNTNYETFDDYTWDRYYNISGTTFTKNDWLISIENQSNWDWGTSPNYLNHIKNTHITIDYYDWGYIDSIISDNLLLLIDTFVDDSNRNYEMFRSEPFRLTSDMLTWDNTMSLNVYDGGNGLQVLCDRLVYPRYNFTIYNSSYINQFDYEQSISDRYYYRIFQTNGKTTSNGIIEFTDYYENFGQYFIDGLVEISLSIDNSISWFILNNEYGGGRLVDGSGCRIDSTDYSIDNGRIQTNAIRFTLGQNGSSDNVIMRIKYKYEAFLMYIGGIKIKDNYWD